MNEQTGQAGLPALSHLLLELANEIDGVADFGLTVCFVNEDEMAGRHLFIRQRCEKTRLIVDSIVTSLSGVVLPGLKALPALQSDLVAGTDLLLVGSNLWSSFALSVRSELVPVSKPFGRMGNNSSGYSAIANALDLLGQSWYAPILERQNAYRTQLEHIGSCFQEEHSAPKAE